MSILLRTLPRIRKAPLTDWQVFIMAKYNIQQVFNYSFTEYTASAKPFPIQLRAAHSIIACKSGALGYNTSHCPDCGYTAIHNCSCRNRNCPNCQAVEKELWIDKRRAEVIDCLYFHVVFTLPHELNPLIYCNQNLLYKLLHKCCAETLLELSADKKYLGATPGIIQVLHTWNQELNYHVHMHCIISGGGLTPSRKLRTSQGNFFIPVKVLRNKFKGKYLAYLNEYYQKEKLTFSASCKKLINSYEWASFKENLYNKDWCPFIKETFHGFGNAIEYLGRYTHKIAISNNRILSVNESETTFSARGKEPGDKKRVITLDNREFIRRFLMHVLPCGFQKIRYYGFLNNRMKSVNLKLIFKLQGYQRFKCRYMGLSIAELLKSVWGCDVSICPACGCQHMKSLGRTYVPLC